MKRTIYVSDKYREWLLDKLKEIMLRTGITQTDLGKELGFFKAKHIQHISWV